MDDRPRLIVLSAVRPFPGVSGQQQRVRNKLLAFRDRFHTSFLTTAAPEEIENVSTNLADLIQNISNAARQQAASAGHISNTMNVIQEITSQTADSTETTADSIGNLAGMANEMRSSVEGFKLPA